MKQTDINILNENLINNNVFTVAPKVDRTHKVYKSQIMRTNELKKIFHIKYNGII